MKHAKRETLKFNYNGKHDIICIIYTKPHKITRGQNRANFQFRFFQKYLLIVRFSKGVSASDILHKLSIALIFVDSRISISTMF